MLKIGCHLSASKGYFAMGKDAVGIGANVFQFFTRNPRGGKAKDINPEDVSKFLVFAKEHGITDFLAHAPYTLNACAADERIREFARETFAGDLRRLEYTPGSMYNFHPGSHVGQGADVGISIIIDVLNELLTEEQTTTVLLETMAGKGSEVGRNFEELKQIIDGVKLKEKIGVCLDTCHINDAGYDVVNDFDGVLKEFDKVIGLNYLKAIHINDSMNPMGSHKDRHQKIGEGEIGIKAFEKIINHPSVKDLPFFLETPHDDIMGYKKEIELLRSMYKN